MASRHVWRELWETAKPSIQFSAVSSSTELNLFANEDVLYSLAQNTRSVAMALATDLELPLLDEPVAGMNSGERQDTFATIERS